MGLSLKELKTLQCGSLMCISLVFDNKLCFTGQQNRQYEAVYRQYALQLVAKIHLNVILVVSGFANKENIK